MEQKKGHCKHGEFILSEGCPECIREERERREAAALGELTVEEELDHADIAETDIVKVRYFSESTGETSGREYSYFSEEPLKVGEVVQVPVRDRLQKAVVSAINVPESEIKRFRDQVKTIPAGSIFPGVRAPNLFDPPEPETALDQEEPSELEPEPAPAVEYENEKIELEAAIEAPEGPSSMALILFTPEDHSAVTKLYQEGVRLQDYAQARIISKNADLKPATDDLAIIKKTKDALEEYMKTYVGPLQDQVKQVRAAFAELMAPFNEADILTRNKVREFRAIEQQKLALAQREAAAKGGEFTTELQEKVPDRTRTSQGTQGFQKVYKWEVTDFAKVPEQYKKVDEVKVGGVVRGSKGTIEIPGIRVWTEETVRINTK